MYDRSKFYQGEDIKFDFYINDNNNQKIDLAQFSDIVLYIYNPSCKNCSMIKVSKVVRDGYINLILLPDMPDETVYTAFIDSSISSKLPPGQYVIEINVTASDPNLTDTRFNRIGKAKAFKIERAITKWESRAYNPDAWYPADHDLNTPGYQAHYDFDANGKPYALYSYPYNTFNGGGLWPWMQY